MALLVWRFGAFNKSALLTRAKFYLKYITKLLSYGNKKCMNHTLNTFDVIFTIETLESNPLHNKKQGRVRYTLNIIKLFHQHVL